jgi:lipoprotein-anchoring transpeptidase ErfK/SrfK
MDNRDLNNTERGPRGLWLVLLVVAIIVVACLIFWKAGRKPGSVATRQPVPAQVATTTVVSVRTPIVAPQAATQAVVTPPAVPAVVVAAPVNVVTTVVPVAVTPKPNPAAGIVAEAQNLEQKGDLVAARERYMEALRVGGDDVRADVEPGLGRTATALLFSPMSMPEKTNYVVQAGDSLARICQKFGASPELVQKSNGIRNPHLVKIGDRMRVCTGKFSVLVNRGSNNLVVFMNDQFLKRYPIGTGKYDKTPLGGFVVSEKIAHPPWWRGDGKVIPFGDKENILGTHWLTLMGKGEVQGIRGYGIHGTWDTNAIGRAETAGCVRMLNQDVEELFVMLPIGTPVTIAQ